MKKVFVLFKRDDAVINTAMGDNSSSSSSRNSTIVSQTSSSSSSSSSFFSDTLTSLTSTSSFPSSSSSSITTTTSSTTSSSIINPSSSSSTSSATTSLLSSSPSFSRINGLNTISSTAVVSSSSQDPYYPSVSQSSNQGLSDSSSDSISSVAKTSSSSLSSSYTTTSSSKLPSLSDFKSHSHSLSNSNSKSTPQATISSSLISSTSSSSPSLTSSSFIMTEGSSIPPTTTVYQELTSTTYSYSQEYIITDSATTFTETIPTQTIVSFAINTQDSSSQVSSSFTYQPTPITTDLSYYQTVLSHHNSNNSQAPDQSKGNSNNNKGKIAGGVVGGICGIILAILLIWFLYKRKKIGHTHDEENPFASGGDSNPKFGIFKKFTRKNTSLEELNEKSTPYYGASNLTNNNGNNFNPIINNQTNNHTNRSFESLSSVSASSILQRRGSSSNSITSLQRPSLPSRKSSEESLGLGGLSQNILSHQQHASTKNIKIETDLSNTKHPTSYFAPSDQSDIMNSNANSPIYPSRQMDVLYEEEISDVASNAESSTAELTNTKMAHYKQSSRYNHIGLTPVPPTDLATRISKIPPPIPKPRKALHGSLSSSQNNSTDIYDSLNIQRQREQATGLLDDESFDSSLLDLSSFDDISSSTGSNN